MCAIRQVGVPSENGPDRTLGLPKRPEPALAKSCGVAPLVVAGEIDVFPSEWREVLSQRRVEGVAVVV